MPKWYVHVAENNRMELANTLQVVEAKTALEAINKVDKWWSENKDDRPPVGNAELEQDKEYPYVWWRDYDGELTLHASTDKANLAMAVCDMELNCTGDGTNKTRFATA